MENLYKLCDPLNFKYIGNISNPIQNEMIKYSKQGKEKKNLLSE